MNEIDKYERHVVRNTCVEERIAITWERISTDLIEYTHKPYPYWLRHKGYTAKEGNLAKLTREHDKKNITQRIVFN